MDLKFVLMLNLRSNLIFNAIRILAQSFPNHLNWNFGGKNTVDPRLKLQLGGGANDSGASACPEIEGAVAARCARVMHACHIMCRRLCGILRGLTPFMKTSGRPKAPQPSIDGTSDLAYMVPSQLHSQVIHVDPFSTVVKPPPPYFFIIHSFLYV